MCPLLSSSCDCLFIHVLRVAAAAVDSAADSAAAGVAALGAVCYFVYKAR